MNVFDIKNKINNFLYNNDSWVIEGVYCEKWMYSILKKADLIIILDINIFIRIFRIIYRYIYNKMFNKQSNYKKEYIKNLVHMIKWNFEYSYKNILLNHVSTFKKYNTNIIFIKNINNI